MTITAFEHTEERHVQLVQRLAEPVKVFRQQRAFRQRVVGVGVESSGHGDEVGLEMFQVVQRVDERGAIGGARRGGRDGIIEAVASTIRCAGARITRVLMD